MSHLLLLCNRGGSDWFRLREKPLSLAYGPEQRYFVSHDKKFHCQLSVTKTTIED